VVGAATAAAPEAGFSDSGDDMNLSSAPEIVGTARSDLFHGSPPTNRLVGSAMRDYTPDEMRCPGQYAPS
jgi:hypothetical protein